MQKQLHFSSSEVREQIKQESAKFLTMLPNIEGEKTRTFTTLSLTLFALAFFGIFAMNPTLSTIADLQKQITDDRFVDQKLSEKIANLHSLQSQYVILQPDIPVINNNLPMSPQLTQVVGQIQQVSLDNNLATSVIQLNPVDTASSKNPDFIPIIISYDGQGTIDNISNFITELTSFDRILTVEAINLQRVTLPNTEAVINNDQLHISVRLTAYFKP